MAQGLSMYFPSGNYGFDRDLGVTVLTRAHPLYDTPTIHLGGLTISPGLDQSLIYNSNLFGRPGSANWSSVTSGSVSVASDWSRNALGASIGFSRNQFFEAPSANYTDWHIGLGGGYTIGDGMLSVSYSHQFYHTIGVNIGTVQSDTPVLNQTDTGNISYTFHASRFTFTPNISASAYRYGSATQGGVVLDQSFLNRNVLAGGLTVRYSMSDAGGLLVVLRGIASRFPTTLAGQPSNNSNSVMLLGGFDYQAEGPLRYRFLAGVESRSFASSVFQTHTAPIVEGGVIWTPTELTTFTGSLSRVIEDPAAADTGSYVLSEANLVIDHELRRNVFLQARASGAYAEFFQNINTGGGTQILYSMGVGATWLMNRYVRVSLNYDYTRQTSRSSSPIPVGQAEFGQNTIFTNSYTQHLVALTCHVGL